MHTIRYGRLLAVAVLLGTCAACAVLDNFRAVEAGQFYRSGQMESGALTRTLKAFDIRTVVNLRGVNPEERWYQEEIAACEKAGVTHHDLPWSKNRLPEPASLATFVDICETADRPILVHCQGGTHRSGAASACYVLLNGGSVEDARKQFGLFFNDAYVGTIIDLYDGSELGFAEWVRTVYPSVYATVPPSAPDKDADEE
ncbi:MAG: tyrosine-protein phosphatase [FCB group bacterium]|jgi:protein tyrosine/serine phosphatase|nr:tyrosine-protein phosphatase [FCB group bacterium]